MKIKEIKIVNQDQSTEIADIGADAINVDYNDTTVKAELDKLNTSNSSLINTQTSQGTKLVGLQSQINGLASGSPLVASSVAGMTNTEKIYVNTTDGHWYYYNGTTWADGGEYQAAEDSDTLTNLDKNFSEIAYIPENLYENGKVNNLGVNTSGTLYPNTGGYASSYIEIPEDAIGWFGKNISILVFYDDNDSKLGVTTRPNNYHSFPTIYTTKKIRFSVNPSYINDAFITFVQNSNVGQSSKIKTESLILEEIFENIPENSISSNALKTQEIIDLIKNNSIKHVACYGDSLTEGAGSTNAGVYSYPVRLRTMIRDANDQDWTVSNRGIGGEVSRGIMARQGSLADYVQPFVIPADTTSVNITDSFNMGNLGVKNGINPVTIAGIQGTYAYNSGNKTFTRLEAGEQITVSRPTQILTSSCLADKNSILIAFVGTNDTNKTANSCIRNYRRMIDYNGNNKFIIIGFMANNSSTLETITNINNELAGEFGSQFINLQDYLINYGLNDNNLTATEQDSQDITNGFVPSQLRNDGIHLNNYGYYSMALCIYKKGQELGYWK